jgi:hypothetical protein
MPRRTLALRRERLAELAADDLARIAAGRPAPLDTQLCNCTGTSHPVSGLQCVITLDGCLAS